MDLFNSITSKRLVGFGLGWLSGYYLSNFALLTISILGGYQLYWIYDKNGNNTNTDENYYWNNVIDIIFTNTSYFPIGYLMGIISQKFSFWIIIIGISGGYAIAHHYTPTDIEILLAHFWHRNRGTLFRGIEYVRNSLSGIGGAFIRHQENGGILATD